MNRAIRFLSTILFGVVAITVFAGCTHTGRVMLDDTRWTLAAWSISSQHAAETGITAAFSNGSVTGHSGVNTYGGPYGATPAGAFSVGPLHITEMAGPEPSMRAERIYMTLLGQAASYKTREGRLTLYDAGGNESLIFESAQATPSDRRDR